MGKIGFDILTGEYTVTLDEAGRINLPKRLRDILEKDKVWLTRGIDRCLRLYASVRFDEMRTAIIDTTNQFIVNDSSLRRRILAAQDLDIDKQGRILVPPMLREWAGLYRDCVVIGQYDYVEIWAEDRYKEYLNASEDEFRVGSEKLGAKIMKDKEINNDGDRSHSGIAGGNDAIARPEGQV